MEMHGCSVVDNFFPNNLLLQNYSSPPPKSSSLLSIFLTHASADLQGWLALMNAIPFLSTSASK